MAKRENHIAYLFAAELQFRLASAVRLAANGNLQPLDLPIEWARGRHRVRYDEIALRQDQAKYAAFLLHRNTTLTMAVAIKDSIEALAPKLPDAVKRGSRDGSICEKVLDAIRGVEPKPWKVSDEDVETAYHIARLIRNAYSHAPFAPTWTVHKELRKKVFEISKVIKLDTTNLNNTPFDWRHYEGELALFKLCRFTRCQILGDDPSLRKVVPIPRSVMYQQGELILKKVDTIPPDAVPVDPQVRRDGGIDLGGGYVLYPGREEDE